MNTFLMCLLVFFLGLALGSVADDNPPTVLDVTLSGFVIGPHTHSRSTVPSSADSVQNAVPVGGDDTAYRWYTLKSGTPVCIFTANKRGGTLEDVGGGRNLYEGSAHAYIQRGYHSFAVQGTCDNHSIPLCSGVCN